MGGVLLAIGVGVMLLSVGGSLLEANRVRDWDERSATVLSAALESSRDSDGGRTWSVSARYRYHAGGREHVGTRVGLSGGSDNLGSWHRRTVDRLQAARRANTAITIYVDPDDPTRSIIDPHPRPELMLFMSLFGMVFGGVGAVMLWSSRRSRADQALRVRGDGSLQDWPVSLAGRTLHASGRPLRHRLYGVAAWLGFTVLVALIGVLDPANITDMTMYLAVLATLAGIGLLILVTTLHALWRERRGGPASVVFEPSHDSEPGRLEGRCRIGGAGLEGTTFKCRLTLDERRWRGKKLSTRAIWQGEIERAAAAALDGVEFDVAFEMPIELLENYETVPELQLHWTLTVRSRRPTVTREFRSAIVTPAMLRSFREAERAR